MAATVAFDVRAELGEGALWDWRHGVLISVDIPAGLVLRSDPRVGSTQALAVGQPVGAAMLRGDDELLLAVRDGFVSLDPATGAVTELARVEADLPQRRMNDAACDPGGRGFAGTMADPPAERAGALYRLDPDLSVHMLIDGLSVSNGIGWSPAGDLMYHVELLPGLVHVCDYDIDSGGCSHRRVLIEAEPAWGKPDGLTVDVEGGIWVAFLGGGALRRFDPDGGLSEIVDLPVPRPTRPAFGGADLDRLYVTSARGGELGGAILQLDHLGVRGLPAAVFAG
jgi:sugar lactone lactonase YvrE